MRAPSWILPGLSPITKPIKWIGWASEVRNEPAVFALIAE